MLLCVWSVCRDRLLPRWIKIISKTRVTSSMYEEQSFLRDTALLQFVVQVLESLKDFDIVLEASLVRGVNLWSSRAHLPWLWSSLWLFHAVSSSVLHWCVKLLWYYCIRRLRRLTVSDFAVSAALVLCVSCIGYTVLSTFAVIECRRNFHNISKMWDCSLCDDNWHLCQSSLTASTLWLIWKQFIQQC